MSLSSINKKLVVKIIIGTCIIGFCTITLININKLNSINTELLNANNELSAELNHQKQEVEIKNEEITKINNLISDYEKQLSDNQSIISDLKEQLQSANEKIVEMENKVSELNSEIEKKNNTFLGEFKVSFYTPTDGSSTGITATGNRAIPYQTVAVDPNVIPLGTRLYIENYGEVIADDVGGAIKGNKLDFCVATVNEAYSNGVQYLNVWIVE